MGFLFVKTGHLLPELRGRVEDTDGVPIDLGAIGATGALVHMRASGASLPVLDGLVATILNASKGELAHAWKPGQTATSGYYQAEFEVLVGTRSFRVPNPGFQPIRISEGI